MQRICNDLSQVTQAKELCTEAVKLQRTMTCMNPDMTSQAKTMGPKPVFVIRKGKNTIESICTKWN